MMEETEEQMVDIVHHDIMWRNIHKVMMHTKKWNWLTDR